MVFILSVTQLYNINIDTVTPLISPLDLRHEIPVSKKAKDTVFASRDALCNILEGIDKRFIVIVGPCSIHDPNAALDYAHRLTELNTKYNDRLMIIMRVYFEKPRTTIGWKGLINDPDLDGSCRVEKGLRLARQLMIKVNELGLPIATEVLDPISPQYISALISWASIGARTTESQTHREMASGLSMPVGFKNSTDGSVDVALSAMHAAKNPHSFIGIDPEGHAAVVRTNGNPRGHVILRGGSDAPNYHPERIKEAVDALTAQSLFDRILVDCSHANSGKKQENQEKVIHSVTEQVKAGNHHIMGVMIESNLVEGNQPIPDDISTLKYGVSVTDECIGWETTERVIQRIYDSIPNTYHT